MAMNSTIASGNMSMDPEEMIVQTQAGYPATGFHELPLVTRVEQHGLMASVTGSLERRCRGPDKPRSGAGRFRSIRLITWLKVIVKDVV